MGDETKLIEEAARGREAAALLENPLLKAAFSNLRNKWIDTWRQAPVRDREGREYAWMMVKAVDEAEATINHHITNGKLAESFLERLRNEARKIF